jgi:membrane protein YdbS with pleckstrin-like domain
VSGELEPEVEWQRVSPTYIVVDVVGYLISSAVMIAVSFVPWAIWRETWLLGIAALVIVACAITVALTPRRVRSIGFALREDDLVFRRGIAWQRVVAIPYGRMQLVDITRGPLARALGLAELKFVTAAASSAIVIPGLPFERAEELRDRLVALAESRRVGL